jgi:hypothetical protein
MHVSSMELYLSSFSLNMHGVAPAGLSMLLALTWRAPRIAWTPCDDELSLLALGSQGPALYSLPTTIIRSFPAMIDHQGISTRPRFNSPASKLALI